MIDAMFIAGALATKLAEVGVEILTDSVKEENANQRLRAKRGRLATINSTTSSIAFKTDQVPTLFTQHLSFIQAWASSVTQRELRGKRKSVESIYVQLDLFLTPLRQRDPDEDTGERVIATQALNSTNGHAVILGQPGAGKSTLLKRFCIDYFKTGKIFSNCNFLIVIQLRDLKFRDSIHPIFKEISTILPVEVLDASLLRSVSTEARDALLFQAYFRLLDRLGCAILLDGFDEIDSNQTRRNLSRELTEICKTLTSARIILTSRTGEFERLLPNGNIYEIAPLKKEQIAVFAEKWLGSESAGSRFAKELESKPYSGTSVKPLLLSYMCSLFERSGKIPERAARVYEDIVDILLKDWDLDRDVKRFSAYANFSASEKHAFLCRLSFELTTELGKYEFNTNDLERAYQGIYKSFDLPIHQAKEVASEIESHSGLFIETRNRRYEFFHRSVQEFLAAEYIVKLPSLDSISRHIHLLPSQLAIATTLSPLPGEFFSYLVLSRYSTLALTSESFLDTYAIRLAEELPIFEEDKPIAVLALFVLAGFCSNSVAIEKIAHRISAFNNLNHIFQYYSVSQQGGIFHDETLQKRALKLKRPHPYFSLPEELRVTTNIVSF